MELSSNANHIIIINWYAVEGPLALTVDSSEEVRVLVLKFECPVFTNYLMPWAGNLFGMKYILYTFDDKLIKNARSSIAGYIECSFDTKFPFSPSSSSIGSDKLFLSSGREGIIPLLSSTPREISTIQSSGGH